MVKTELHSEIFTVRLRTWHWPVTKTYNGFTGAERIRGWQVSHWLQDTGQLINPQKQQCQCSICGATKNISYHNENYYEPWTAKLVCKSCHFYLHARFRNPKGLEVLRTRARQYEGDNWVFDLSIIEIDIARKMKNKHGEKTSQFPSLKKIEHIFPFNQLNEIE